MDPALLATFARRAYVTDLDSPEAEQDAFERWLEGQRPAVEHLSDDDRALLEARPLTVRQAALRERVSERTVYRWLTSGELDAHRAGRGWRITPDALDRRRVEASRPRPRPAAPPKRRPRRKAMPTTASGREWPS